MLINFSGLLLLVMALSADAFTAGVSYGSDRVRIPACSALILSLCSAFLFLFSLIMGQQISGLLPGPLPSLLSFFTLFFLGLIRLSARPIQKLIQKNRWKDRALRLSFHHIGFIFMIYVRPEQANTSRKEVLSPAESFSLGLALSLDCIAAGISVTAPASLLLPAFALMFAIHLTALLTGSLLGRCLSGCSSLNLSLLSGFLLILLSFGRLF